MAFVIFTKKQCLRDLEAEHQELCRNDKNWNTFFEEWYHHREEYYRLRKEVNEAKRASPRDKRLVEILDTKSRLAESRMFVAVYQRDQRQYELQRQLVQSDGERAEVEAEIREYQGRVHDYEKEVNKYLQELNRLESEKEKDATLAKKLLDDALKDGFSEVVVVVCVIVGQPGVGKTHMKYLLLDRRPPHLRTSTGLADTPLRIEIRSVSASRVQNIRGQWKDVTEGEMLDILAKMIIAAEPHLSQASAETSFFSKVAKLFLPGSQGAAGAKLPNLDRAPKVKKRAKDTSTTASLSEACQKAVKEIMSQLVERISNLREEKSEEQGKDSSPSLSEIVLGSKWVYFTDSGGQPEYHELLPLFVRNVSCALCVTRLTDRLDEMQDVEYFQDGEQVGSSQQAQLSAKDTIQCLVNTIQSYSVEDKPPKVMVVGTHHDKLKEAIADSSKSEAQDEAVETLEEKNRKLLDMLEPEFADQLVYYSSDMKELVFPVNTLNPGEKDKATAESIRLHIEASGAEKIKIPIWWHILELLLQELAKKLGRGVLSKAECRETARLLGIKDDALEAALKFFDKLNVIKYNPDVLPNVVFISSQIPLDKISELVFHRYLLRPKSSKSCHDNTGKHSESAEPAGAQTSGSLLTDEAVSDCDVHVSTCPMDNLPSSRQMSPVAELSGESKDHIQTSKRPLLVDGKWKHFRDKGIVTKECLKHFPKHYVPEIFTIDHLCDFLQYILAFAPIPSPIKASVAGKSETDFIMPALLETLLETKLKQYRVSSPGVAPLLVRFPAGSRRAGVFCCFVVHLIKHFGWTPLLNDAEPLYRNCFKMNLTFTDPPCTVTLIDSNALIEVYVMVGDVAPSKCSALLNVIKNAILGGIDAACIALNYKQTKPEFTFYCPHSCPSRQSSQSDAIEAHTATMNDKKSYLTCDSDRSSYRVEEEHLVWFGLTSVAGKVHSASISESTIPSTTAAGPQQVLQSKSIVITLPKELANPSLKPGQEDLGKVLDHIWGARSRWFNLGMQLSVSIGDLEAINSDHQEKSGECLRAMLLKWLRKTDPSPTWKALVDALNAPSVGVLVQLTDSS